MEIDRCPHLYLCHGEKSQLVLSYYHRYALTTMRNTSAPLCTFGTSSNNYSIYYIPTSQKDNPSVRSRSLYKTLLLYRQQHRVENNSTLTASCLIQPQTARKSQ